MTDLDNLLIKLTETQKAPNNIDGNVDEAKLDCLKCGSDGHLIKFYLLPIAWNANNGQRLVISSLDFYLKPIGVSMAVHNATRLRFSYDMETPFNNIISKTGYKLYKDLKARGVSSSDDIFKQCSSMLPNYSNMALVLVTKDKKNPQNEGKIMRFKLRKYMMEQINKKANPSESDLDIGVVQGNPFNHLTAGVEYGANVVNKKGSYKDVDFSGSGFIPNSVSLDEYIKSGKVDGIETIEALKESIPDLEYYLPKNESDATVIKKVSEMENDNNSFKLFSDLDENVEQKSQDIKDVPTSTDDEVETPKKETKVKETPKSNDSDTISDEDLADMVNDI